MNMKRVMLFALLAVNMIVIMSCGGSDSGGGSGHAPTISGLWTSPQSAKINDGGGTISVIVGFEYSDSGADLGTYQLTAYDTSNEFVGITKSATLTPGATSGWIQFTVSGVVTTAPASYRFEVYVTDIAASQSNTLTRTFTIS